MESVTIELVRLISWALDAGNGSRTDGAEQGAMVNGFGIGNSELELSWRRWNAQLGLTMMFCLTGEDRSCSLFLIFSSTIHKPNHPLIRKFGKAILPQSSLKPPPPLLSRVFVLALKSHSAGNADLCPYPFPRNKPRHFPVNHSERSLFRLHNDVPRPKITMVKDERGTIHLETSTVSKKIPRTHIFHPMERSEMVAPQLAVWPERIMPHLTEVARSPNHRLCLAAVSTCSSHYVVGVLRGFEQRGKRKKAPGYPTYYPI
ncbi:hypothetical protein B0J18DRAFT_267633 [Chaetomium sp. MPI-SDFR-AT-0129]|nr:hypothetical protein B0J18DRAFT_267633 [Chaetomium sp. MPI-SDFR-AT-0129]